MVGRDVQVVWIRLPGLPKGYYSECLLYAIGQTIGPVIKLDEYTDNVRRRKFKRLAYEIYGHNLKLCLGQQVPMSGGDNAYVATRDVICHVALWKTSKGEGSEFGNSSRAPSIARLGSFDDGLHMGLQKSTGQEKDLIVQLVSDLCNMLFIPSNSFSTVGVVVEVNKADGMKIPMHLIHLQQKVRILDESNWIVTPGHLEPDYERYIGSNLWKKLYSSPYVFKEKLVSFSSNRSHFMLSWHDQWLPLFLIDPRGFHENCSHFLQVLSSLESIAPSWRAMFMYGNIRSYSLLILILLITAVIAGSIFDAFFYLLLCGLLGLVVLGAFFFLRSRNRFQQVEEDHLDNMLGMPTRFSYEELKNITKNFSNKLGEGGFGSVSEGTLPSGSQVAVKHLFGIGPVNKSFVAEVQTIGSIHHFNLVSLVGFCAEKFNRLLVYEYMANGSLDRWIFNKNQDLSLDWQVRKKIILDIAKGLAYLHEDCNRKIIHLDIKPQNILLDENFNAKVSDFGFI
ncbi:hypothetical protein CXB51_025513 [Gossypium anomalum]|uniref:non-specific serine/threonine protein kinase n=1 Tax=Gossypium anomalum TaxID=47600 RepID=A0A8J6CSH9_9ROSI|nr:hypothetical protein CXB51_025513 [Gossypium anomalum]